MKKNPYKIKQGYLPNPTNPLYQDDVEISDNPEIQELVQLAYDLEDEISTAFDIEFLTFQIKNNALSFCRTGMIAFKIKSQRLFKKVTKTFKEYCEKHIGYSVWYVNRLIQASKVVLDLVASNISVLPKNEAQARELLYASEGDVVRAWRSVTKEFEPHKITAKAIRQHLKPQEDKPKEENIKVDCELYKAIRKAAMKADMKVSELLEEIFQPVRNCDNWQGGQLRWLGTRSHDRKVSR